MPDVIVPPPAPLPVPPVLPPEPPERDDPAEPGSKPLILPPEEDEDAAVYLATRHVTHYNRSCHPDPSPKANVH